MIVGDGNFKTDHVKQKKNDDVWLYDGGGMVPNQLEYANFIKTALEIPTVSPSHTRYIFLSGPVIGPGGIGTQNSGPVYRDPGFGPRVSGPDIYSAPYFLYFSASSHDVLVVY